MRKNRKTGLLFLLVTLTAVVSTWAAGGFVYLVAPNTGPYGGDTNSVYISGSNLFLTGSNPYVITNTDLKSVTLGGSPAVIKQATAQWVAEGGYTYNTITIIPGPAAIAGAVDVSLFSEVYGTSVAADGYFYNYPGSITNVSLDSGPSGGGNTVTITGTNLTDGTLADISSITLNGVAVTATNIVSSNKIEVTAGDGSLELGTGDVVLVSSEYGTTTKTDGYAYNWPGTITNVSPSSGFWMGGYSVEITGSNLCANASDLNYVSLVGLSGSVTSATPDRIYVVAANGSSVAGTTGSVRSSSIRYGENIRANSFLYRPIPSITNISTNVGPSAGGNTVVITGENLATNTSEVEVTFLGVTGTVVYADSTTITATVAAAKAETPRDTLGDVVVNSSWYGPVTNANAYAYHYAGAVTNVAPDNGPGYGGNQVVLTGSNLCTGAESDITSITLNGIEVVATGTVSSTSITVTAGDATGAEGQGNVVITSTEYGTTTLNNGYTYNQLGGITNVAPTNGLGVGGYDVVIQGSNLCAEASDVSVTLNGIGATVKSASLTEITVTAGDGSSVAGQTGDVVVTSVRYGVVTNANAFSYRYNPAITNVTPNRSPFGGSSTQISITGSNLCLNAGDISRITFCGTNQTAINSASPTEIVLVGANSAETAGSGDVVVVSDHYGTSIVQNAFTYEYPGGITNVAPAQGPAVGGNTVTITGSNLCDGTTADIRWIKLNGVDASATGVVSETSVTFTAGDGSVAIGTGVVTIDSTKYGGTTKMNAYTYNYPGAVTNASMTNGPAVGGNTVVLTGSNLCDGTSADITSITLNGIPVKETNSVSATSITVVAGEGTSKAGTTGDIQVVSTDFGTSVLADGYSYNYPGGITTVSPSESKAAGGITVDITGTNLCNSKADITSITFNGKQVTATNSATATAIQVVVAPSGSNEGSTGAVTIVSSLFGTTTKSEGFIYNPTGQITSLSINNGPSSGGQSVRISGSNMCESDGSDIDSVTFCGIAAAVTNVAASYIDVTTAQLPSGLRTTGNVVVVSTNFGTYTLTDAYIYNAAPSITNVTPTNMPYCGGRLITIQGDNLCNGQQSDIYNILIGNASATGITVNGTGEITCYTPPQTAGLTNITTYSTSHGADRVTDAIYYNYAPAITNIAPTNGPLAGGTTVTIQGSNMAESVSSLLSITLNGIAVVQTNSVSHTEIVVKTGAGSAAGTGDLLINDNKYGTSMYANAWTYNPAPAITNVTPASGPFLGGNLVTVQGTSLCEADGSDLSSVSFKGRAATNILYKSATVITAQLDTATADTAGTAGDVVVVSTNFGTATKSAAYTYNWPGGVTNVAPDNGPATGGYSVVISGSNLCSATAGDVSSITLNGVAVSVTNVNSSSQITVTAGDGIGHIGAGSVVITSTEFGTTTENNGFTYNNVPGITNISPASGPQWGGNQVTITGSNLCGGVSDIASITIAGQTPTVDSASANSIVLRLPNPGMSVTGPVVVSSTRYGNYSSAPSNYTFNPAGGISEVSPASGPYYGGNSITIKGTDLGNGTDITNVTIGTVSVTSFTSQYATQVVFNAAAGAGQSGALKVTVYSETFGATVASNAYTYNPTPVITEIYPTNAPISGGSKITIRGTNLGSGSDVTGVTLAGVAVASIGDQSATQVVVTASAHSAVTGEVVVTSTSFGISTNVNDFTYVEPAISGITPGNGPKVGSNTVTISGAWLGMTNDVTSVTLAGVDGVIQSQSGTQVVVYAGGAAESVTGKVVITSTYYGAITSAVDYTYNAAGSITNIAPHRWGPSVGGNDVVIQGVGLGSGGTDITQVLFGAQSAYISSQAVDWVGITNVPAALATGKVDIVVYSTARGKTEASDYYAYNYPAAITNISPANGPLAGGNTIVITGSNLCENAGDLTSVTLAGVAANEVSATPERIEVTAGVAGSSVTGNVVITSTQHGTLTEVGAYIYNPAGVVTSVSTNNGPLAGGTEVTVYGSNLGNGVDITNVTVKGVAAVLKNQLSTMVQFTTADGTTAGAGLGAIVIQSISRGETTENNAFTYNPAGAITTIEPGFSRLSGGVEDIIISGSNLGNSDVTSVTLNGVAATVTGQNDTQVRVSSGVATTPGTGDVVIVSTDFGTTIKSNAFIYYDQQITNISMNSGRMVGSNLVEITGMNIGMTGDIYRVSFNGFDGALATNAQSSTNVWVWTGAATNAGLGDVKVYSRYFIETTLSNAWTYNPTGFVSMLTPDNGPAGMPNTLTIVGENLCATNALDVTNITVAGETALTPDVATPTQIVVRVDGASTNVTGKVLIHSLRYGSTEWSGTYSFYTNKVGTITPTNGPLVGGNEVTIYAAPGSRISTGSGTDITNVYFGTNVASITSQDETSVVVQVSANTAAEAVNVMVCSAVYGDNTVLSGYTFNPAGEITSVDPKYVPQNTGNVQVTIKGTNLGSGDITNVTLAGKTATLGAQSDTQIVVTAASAASVTGDVVVMSTSYGTTTKSNAFAYVVPQITGVNPSNGPLVGGNTVTISGSFLGRTNDITSVTLKGVSATITEQSATQVKVTAGNGTAAEGIGDVVVNSTFYGTTTKTDGYTYNPAGNVTNVTPMYGPIAGGNSICIQGTQLGNGSDVTNVLIGTREASVTNQSQTQLWVEVPAIGSGAQTNNITIYSTSRGKTEKANAYMYNYPSAINAVTPNGCPLSGGQITITGSNLCENSGEVKVSLAGVAVSNIVSAVPTQIVVTATSTLESVTGAVTVVSTRYGTTTLPDSFTYHAPGSISAISPDNGPNLGNATVVISGYNLCADKDDVTALVIGGVTQSVVRISSANPTQIVFLTTAPWPIAPSSGPAVIASTQFGTTTSTSDYTFANYGVGSAMPNNGPYAGGNTVTVYAVNGGRFATDNDITNVTFGGVEAQIISQDATSVVVVAGTATMSGQISVDVYSEVYGQQGNTVYTNNPAGVIAAVVPAQMTTLGGESVTITGTNLNDGTTGDVLSVSLAGVAARVDSVCSTQLVVTAGEAGAAITGDVLIVSTRFGTTTKENSFIYTTQTEAAIRVTLTPAGAVTDGAQWKLSSMTNWMASGSTATGLTQGVEYTVTFDSVTNWTKPADMKITPASADLVVTSAVYVCKTSLSPSSVTVGGMSTNGMVQILTGTGCAWTSSVPVEASWVTITNGASGTGVGSLYYTVDEWTNKVNRSATLTIADQSFYLLQRGTGVCLQPIYMLLLLQEDE